MPLQKISLIGCERYSYKGELYEKGKVYLVGEAKATNMLRAKDDYDRPYFVPYVKPVKSEAEQIAQAATKAAVDAAAKVVADAAAIERPDGSEPVDPAEVAAAAAADPEAIEEVVIDTDDDPTLDEPDEANPEEVVADRDDGSAVEV